MVDITRLNERLKNCQEFVHTHKVSVAGRLVRVVGLTLEAVGVKAAVGSQCLVETAQGDLIAEIVGF
jgi:flagellum-specific ATP synthase